jgi:hypothetical protein
MADCPVAKDGEQVRARVLPLSFLTSWHEKPASGVAATGG